MILRPDSLITYTVYFVFNFRNFSFIEVDLIHVNNGKHGLRNTELSIVEVARLIKLIFHDESIEASDEKLFGNYSCAYFANEKSIEGKVFKAVVCVCSDRPDTLGVMTLFRLRSFK